MPSRHDILHSTEISAPIETVWKELIAIDGWEKWNKWTILIPDGEDKATPVAGASGKLYASFDEKENEQWKKYDFTFGRVNDFEHVLTWFGSAGPSGCLFSGYHTTRLESISPKRTRLIHQELFGGVLPMLGLGLPYKKLRRNYLLMNEALKRHVENKVASKR